MVPISGRKSPGVIGVHRSGVYPIDVHCSKSAKIYKFASIAARLFWYIGGAKIAL